MTTAARAGVSERNSSTRVVRQAKIVELIRGREIASQSELAEILAQEGISVSQGTLSKDLLDIGAVRVRSANGVLVYAPPGSEIASAHALHEQRLARICAEVLVSADSSANLVIFKTPPGAAQYFASAIDHVALESVIGTIAGDDTVMTISRRPDGGADLAQYFLTMARTGRPPAEMPDMNGESNNE